MVIVFKRREEQDTWFPPPPPPRTFSVPKKKKKTEVCKSFVGLQRFGKNLEVDVGKAQTLYNSRFLIYLKEPQIIYLNNGVKYMMDNNLNSSRDQLQTRLLQGRSMGMWVTIPSCLEGGDFPTDELPI